MSPMYASDVPPSRQSPLTPRAIRHLPAARQRRYVRLTVLRTLREAERDLSAPEVRERTGLDARTVREELTRLVATREVEKILRRGPTTYRLIGQPTSPFAKYLVRLQHGAYTIEQVRSGDGRDVLVLQERREARDGTYEPIGGLAISREDLGLFIEEIERRVEGSKSPQRKSRRT